MNELYELRDMLFKELKEYGKRGDLSSGSLDVIDKLAHAVKNLDKVIDAGGEYSGRMYGDGTRSYVRRRDSMGRYAGTYSRRSFADHLRDLMDEAPDDHTRTEIQHLIDKM